jgi:hypothetical protein
VEDDYTYPWHAQEPLQREWLTGDPSTSRPCTAEYSKLIAGRLSPLPRPKSWMDATCEIALPSSYRTS